MSDELFNREEFVSYFRDEAEELLQQIDGDLLKLEEFATSKESDPEIINSLFRALHTIKGSGGMLGFTDVQGLAHKLENLCDLLRKDQMPLSESCVDILFSGRDFLTDLVAIAVGGEDAAAPGGLAEYMNRLDQFVAVYEETANVIEGRTGPAQSFDEAVGNAKPAAEVEAFEAEIERLLKEAEAERGGMAGASPAAQAPASEPAVETPEPVAATPAAVATPAPAVEIAAGAKEAEARGQTGVAAPDHSRRHRASRRAAQSRRRTRHQPHAHLGHRQHAGTPHGRQGVQ